MPQIIHVDGSMMEGGGQLLRNAIAYSAILDEPIQVINIRAKREPSGLKPQHLTTLKAAANICNAEISGLKLGSKDIKFFPGEINGGSYKFDIGTAGSISLLLQCLVPITTFANKKTELIIIGGTAVKWSPPIPFLENIVYKSFRDMGMDIKIKLLRHGFYPKGGGKVKVTIVPTKIKPLITSKRQNIENLYGISLCGKLPFHVAERQAKAAIKVLGKNKICANIEQRLLTKYEKPLSPGSFICMWTQKKGAYIGADSLGEKGKPAEVVGRDVANSILASINTTMAVDPHTTDHVILPASLAQGKTEFTTTKITLHTLTAIKLAKTFTNSKFSVTGKIGSPGKITCSKR